MTELGLLKESQLPRTAMVGVLALGAAVSAVQGPVFHGIAGSTTSSAATIRGISSAGTKSDAVLSTFERLKAEWRRGTRFVSSMEARTEHPSYRRIIGLGKRVLPFLLIEMRDNPDHWSKALIKISGENPIPENLRGNLRAVADAWVSWGRKHGYLV